MIDPLSILSVTGFSLECIDFLLSSLSKLEDTGRGVLERTERLREYRRQLTYCKTEIESWFRTWGSFTDEDYCFFWGEDTYNDIQIWLPDIKTLVQGIQRTIEGLEKTPLRSTSSMANALDWETWRRTERKDFDGHRFDMKRLQVFSRIGFALFSNQKLQERFQRLKQTLQNLEKISRSKFRAIRRENEDIAVQRRELDHAIRTKSVVDSITAFASSLFEAQKATSNDHLWTVELRRPDPYGNAQRVDFMAKIYLDFAIQTVEHKTWMAYKRVRIPYKSKRESEQASATSSIATLVADIMAELSSSDPTGSFKCSTGHNRISTDLPHPSRLSLPFRTLILQGTFSKKETMQAWSGDQACLLRGLVNWMLLLWKTEWTQGPCCCGIRFQKIIGEGQQYILARDPQHQCHSSPDTVRKLVALGVTLAEIITATPLRVTQWPGSAQSISQSATIANQPNITHKLERWDFEDQDWSGVDREEVLQAVWANSSQKVADAVSYCLEPDPSMDDSQPGFFDKYRQHILSPVDQYCQLLLDHRKEFENTTWWRGFVTSIFGCDWPPEAVFEHDGTTTTADIAMPGVFVDD